MILAISLLAILALIIIASLIYVFSPDCEFIKIFLPNIIGGLIAAFFVTLSVDVMLWRREKRQKKKMKRIAAKRLWRETLPLLEMFVQMWKASVERKPEELPVRYDDFLKGDYHDAYKRFDLSTAAPVVPEREWYVHFANVLKRFKVAIDTILDVYHSYMDATFVKKIEDVVGHPYMKNPDSFLGKREQEKSGAIERKYGGEPAILAHEYFIHLNNLLEQISQEIDVNLVIYENILRDDHQPLWSSGYNSNLEMIKIL